MRIKYYLAQSGYNLRRSVLTILGISLAISMVAGLNYYNDSVQTQIIENSFENILDYDFRLTDPTTDFVGNYDGELETLESYYDKYDLDVAETFEFALVELEQTRIWKNYSGLGYSEAERGGLPEIVEIDCNLFLADNTFYMGDRFTQYFSIIDGGLPVAGNDIMVGKKEAYYLNLTVGSITNISSLYSYRNVSDGDFYEHQFNFEDVHVVGIYEPNYRYYRIGWNGYSYWPGEDYYNPDYGWFHLYDSNPFFFNFNFTVEDPSHSVLQFISDWDDFHTNLWVQQVEDFGILHGFAGITLRDINYNRLRSTAQNYLDESSQIEFKLIGQGQEVEFDNHISQELEYIIIQSNFLRFILQMMNLPTLIFGIILGAFSVKTNTKSRTEEILLLKSKGTPKKMLNRQFFIEGIVLGLACSIIGSLMGLGTFFAFREVLGTDIISDFISINQTNPNPDIVPNLSGQSLLINMIFGIVIAFFANLGARYIKKLRTDQLINSLGQVEMNIVYDEVSLFETQKNLEEAQIAKTKAFRERFNKNEGVEPSKNTFTGRLKNLFGKKEEKIFETNVEIHEKGKAKLSYFFVGISFFIVIPFILFYWAGTGSAPDVILNLTDRLTLLLPVFMMIAIFSPILMVIGIVRFIAVEKPSRIAKISRFLSKIFIKERSYLTGIEMAGRKQYKTLMILIGIFTALITFTNIALNSMVRYDVITRNIWNGADLRVVIDQYDHSFQNTGDIEEFNDYLLSLGNSSETNYIKDVLTVYKEEDRGYTHFDLGYANPRYQYYFDFELYVNVITEGGKFLPNKAYLDGLNDIIQYNNNPENALPGIVVTPAFLEYEDEEIGDTISFWHTYYNSNSDLEEQELISAKIIKSMEMFPGIDSFYGSNYQGSSATFLDLKFVHHHNQTLHSDEFIQLVDLDYDKISDPETLEEDLLEDYSPYVSPSRFYLYEQDWDTVKYSYGQDEAGFFSIIYLDFIIIGVLIGVGVTIMILSIQKEAKFSNGILLVRGFGKKGIFLMITSILFIIYSISLAAGIFSGTFSAMLLLKLQNFATYPELQLPIFMDIGELAGILGFITGIAFIIYFLSFLINRRQQITKYFHKF